MKDNKLEELFKELDLKFNYEEPNIGHNHRFLQKLEAQQEKEAAANFNYRKLIAPFLAIAATLLLFVSLNFYEAKTNVKGQLADVSTEMSKTQSFFILAIKENLEKIEGKRSAETKKIIDDAMIQMEILENDYKSLQTDLQVSGDDQRVIFAMISNFQNRVNLLNTVLEQINQVTNINNETNEDNNTI